MTGTSDYVLKDIKALKSKPLWQFPFTLFVLMFLFVTFCMLRYFESLDER